MHIVFCVPPAADAGTRSNTNRRTTSRKIEDGRDARGVRCDRTLVVEVVGDRLVKVLDPRPVEMASAPVVTAGMARVSSDRLQPDPGDASRSPGPPRV